MENNLLTVQEVAKLLGIGKNAAYDIVKQPDFPAIKIGSRIKTTEEWVYKWIQQEALKPKKTSALTNEGIVQEPSKSEKLQALIHEWMLEEALRLITTEDLIYEETKQEDSISEKLRALLHQWMKEDLNQ